MSAGDIIALVAAVGSMLSGVATVIGLFRRVPRGSDLESRRAAEVAVEVAKDTTVTAIEQPKRDGESA